MRWTHQPVRDRHQTASQQLDIETQMPVELVFPFLLGRQQVHQ